MRLSSSALLLVPLAGFGYFLMPKSGSERYLLTGSSTVAPILQQVAEDLHANDPALQIDVETGGSGRGIQDARAKASNIGMASRELTAEESAGLDVRKIAHDGIALIVHRENPLAGLSSEQVLGVYRGSVANWSELGADEGEIFVANKAEGRATLTVFLEHFKLKNSEIQADAVIGDNAQGVRLVAGNPRAIAYISIGEALSAVERDEPIHMLALDGVAPTKHTVADGTYPLRRSLYLLFPEKPDAVGEHILAHLASERGNAILTELGFVPLDVVE
jgi:phosphate transport system substrate-binding protein